MEVLKCIIVEDEPLAGEIISDYIADVPFLDCLATFTNPMLALHWIMENSVDVIFLDINMPRIKGYEFINAAKGDYQYIITTAYQEFAVDSYQWGVVDYLLKPIDFARFTTAVAKLKKKKNDDTYINISAIPDNRIFRYYNVNKNYVKVNLHDILYIESIKDYLKIVTGSQVILTKGKITDVETDYTSVNIIRIHRSFMVNLNHIESFNQNEIFIAGQLFSIGRQYKDVVHKMLGGLVKPEK